MKKSLVVAVLSSFVILGLGTAGIAQQTDSSSSAQSQTKSETPSDKSSNSSSSSSSATAPKADDRGSATSATPKADDRAPATSAAPAQDRSSSSSTTNIEVKPGARSDSGESAAASPRTGESRRILGLEPTAAVLIAAAILVVVVLALVAMSRGGTEPSSHTDIDLDRRR